MSGFELLEPSAVVLVSASNGAGGGVVSIVQPINQVIPSIPRTPRTTGISIAYVLHGSPVREIRYTMNTIAETANIRPPYDWSLFKSGYHSSRQETRGEHMRSKFQSFSA